MLSEEVEERLEGAGELTFEYSFEIGLPPGVLGDEGKLPLVFNLGLFFGVSGRTARGRLESGGRKFPRCFLGLIGLVVVAGTAALSLGIADSWTLLWLLDIRLSSIFTILETCSLDKGTAAADLVSSETGEAVFTVVCGVGALAGAKGV